MTLDPYELLGVARTATKEEIRAAYRRAAKKSHPDMGGDRAEFDRLTLAHETLTDDEARANYDQNGVLADRSADNEMVPIMAHLVGAFEQVIRENEHPHMVDVVKEMGLKLAAHLDAIARNLDQLETYKRKLLSIQKRFKRKRRKTQPNGLRSIVESKLSMIAQLEDGAEATKKEIARAREILEEYGFDFERALPPLECSMSPSGLHIVRFRFN